MGTTSVDDHERTVFATPFVYTSNVLMGRSYSLFMVVVSIILLCKGGNDLALQIMIGICILIFLFMTFWRLPPNIHRRIILEPDAVWIGGLTCDARVPYESVRLVRVDGGLRRDDELVVEWEGKGGASLVLRSADADRCLHALLDRCGLAAGVDAGGELYGPIEADPAKPDRDELRAFLRKKARNAMIGAWFALTIWLGLVISISVHRLTIVSAPLVWLMAVLLPVGVVVAFVTARQRRQTLREHESGPCRRST